MTEIKLQSDSSYLDTIKQYISLIWDGYRFFSFDENKLSHLKEGHARWYDRFKNPRIMAFYLIITTVVITIAVKELSIIG